MIHFDCSYCGAMVETRVEAASDDARTFQMVVVCTGNRARSPLTAALLTRRLAHLPVRVMSAGTLDLGDVPALPNAIETASRLGLDLRTHRARAYRGSGLGGADLILGFERHHLATAVVDWGAARERTFTLPGLVELLEDVAPPDAPDPVGRARLVVARADGLRRHRTAIPELADPLGRPATFYRQMATRLTDLCDRLSIGLFGECAFRRERPVDVAGDAGQER